MKDAPLSLLFAPWNGAYEANVQVLITPLPPAAASMRFRADGPVCLLRLPPGNYQVEAELQGQTRSHNVQVDGTPRTLDFRF